MLLCVFRMDIPLIVPFLVTLIVFLSEKTEHRSSVHIAWEWMGTRTSIEQTQTVILLAWYQRTSTLLTSVSSLKGSFRWQPPLRLPLGRISDPLPIESSSDHVPDQLCLIPSPRTLGYGRFTFSLGCHFSTAWHIPPPQRSHPQSSWSLAIRRGGCTRPGWGT